jgi:hypothetical protein
MEFFSLQPFIPSGSDFEKAKLFFQELGFTLSWNDGGYAGFKNANCQFILQQYDVKAFAENLMISVQVADVAALREEILAKKLPQQFGIRISEIQQQSYGLEVNLIDMAGVCWHFVQV